MSALKSYIGDGVYVDTDGFGLVLTTENGIDVTNTIYLEPEVLRALNDYNQRLRERKDDAISKDSRNEENG